MNVSAKNAQLAAAAENDLRSAVNEELHFAIGECYLSSGTGSPQINAHKRLHGARVVQRLLDRGVREIKAVLEKVNPQHALDPHRRAPGTSTARVQKRSTASLPPQNALRRIPFRYVPLLRCLLHRRPLRWSQHPLSPIGRTHTRPRQR